MAKSKKPALSTADIVNWWKDGDDIHIAHGTMFTIHKVNARKFEVKVGWHHFKEYKDQLGSISIQHDSRVLSTGKLKECKLWVEQQWFENYIIEQPCPRGWDSTETPYLDEGELIEAALEGALDDHYEVVVGNVGTVYSGFEPKEATDKFNTYVEQSRTGIGRAGHESVTMLKNGNIVSEFMGDWDKRSKAPFERDEDDIVLPPSDDSNPFQRNDAGGRDTPLPLPEVLPFTKVPALPLCECRHSECSCGGICRQPAPEVLYRTDMEDTTGTPMCEECSEDAIPSGIYNYCPPYMNDSGDIDIYGIWDKLDDGEPTDPIQTVWDRFDAPQPLSKDILPGESTLDRIADVIVLFIGLAWSIIGLA